MLLAIVFNSYSQVPTGFYAAAGYNQGMFVSDELQSKSGIGYTAGLAFNIGYAESHNYTIETMYTVTPLEFEKINSSGDYINDKYEFNNFDIGLSYNYYIIHPDEDKFYVGALLGFVASIGAISEISSESGFYLPKKELQSKDIERFQGINLSPSFGLISGFNKFRLAFKYNLGTTNLMNSVHPDKYKLENGSYGGPTLVGKLSSINIILSYSLKGL